MWWYCRKLLRFGGPAVGVASILRTEAFRAGWEQDRAVEEWVITQHPGGYLHRRPRSGCVRRKVPTGLVARPKRERKGKRRKRTQ